MEKNLNTPIWQITTGELIEMLNDYFHPEPAVKHVRYDENLVHGYSGIANLLGVSKVMVWQYRRSGWIEPAIKQIGRKIICDGALALKLFGERK